jgi:hypothetical protein
MLLQQTRERRQTRLVMLDGVVCVDADEGGGKW